MGGTIQNNKGTWTYRSNRGVDRVAKRHCGEHEKCKNLIMGERCLKMVAPRDENWVSMKIHKMTVPCETPRLLGETLEEENRKRPQGVQK